MTRYKAILAFVGMSIFILSGQWPGQVAADVNVDVGPVHIHTGRGEPPPPEEVQVLTRGPVHEAFAQPVVFDEGPGAGWVVSDEPPAPLNEIVPDEKPEGNHIVWVPGYWSWSRDRDDFIWVSGCWRAVPPGTGWVPGYWAKVRGGYQWIPGFWTAADTEEIEYLPSPPATLEEGPPGPGSPDSIWIPGCWVYQQGRYAWRSGFWEQARPNWVWVPSYYVCSPRGCIYVDGYWDYPLERRGVAFLPVYCPPSLYGRAGFEYSPDVVLDPDGLTLNLFISPQRHQYCFGDYYGPEYAREGFYPWYESHDHHDWYDPIFVHQQWQHRDDHQWFEQQRDGYNHRRDDQSLRPAKTYTAMKAQAARLPEKDRKQAQLARPLKEVVSEKTTPFKFETPSAKAHEASASQAKEVHSYKNKRSQWESPPAATKTEAKENAPKEMTTPREQVPTPPKESPKPPAKEAAPSEKALPAEHGAAKAPAAEETRTQKVKVPKPPIAVREPVQDKELAPPPRPEHPKPDPNVRPKAEKDTPERSKQK